MPSVTNPLSLTGFVTGCGLSARLATNRVRGREFVALCTAAASPPHADRVNLTERSEVVAAGARRKPAVSALRTHRTAHTRLPTRPQPKTAAHPERLPARPTSTGLLY